MIYAGTIKNRSQAGFTLVELMTVIAVLGILAAIAIPSYAAFVKQGRIAAAKAAASCLRTEVTTSMAARGTFELPDVQSYADLFQAAPSCLPAPGDPDHIPPITPVDTWTCWCVDKRTIEWYQWDWDLEPPPEECGVIDPIVVIDFFVPKTADVTDVYTDVAIRLNFKHGAEEIAFEDIGSPAFTSTGSPPP